MKNYSDTTSIELTFSEISITLVSLVLRLEKHIKLNGPIIVAEKYLPIIKKLNNVLKENGFDYYTDEKIQEFETYISEHK